ncbi:MAG TPA: TlpA family protein disulfide reductase [Candidatus Avalokitesvara rifleensis]|uniref:TlpA family protein disulfide reductase n=1 Tax=Candidatus Avalokitesvara rifleensis TaxID=3367620 RepID=UPI004029023F
MYRAILVSVFIVCASFSIQTERVEGEAVPFITRINFLGLKAKLDANKGKVIILDFWMSDCPNCRKAAPFMNRMYSKYKGRGLLIIGLSVDKDIEAARKLMSAAGTSYPTFLADNTIMNAYGVKFVPYHIYIDRKGRIKERETGFYEDKRSEIEKEIVELLGESD